MFYLFELFSTGSTSVNLESWEIGYTLVIGGYLMVNVCSAILREKKYDILEALLWFKPFLAIGCLLGVFHLFGVAGSAVILADLFTAPISAVMIVSVYGALSVIGFWSALEQ